jgi:hypothetical protein
MYDKQQDISDKQQDISDKQQDIYDNQRDIYNTSRSIMVSLPAPHLASSWSDQRIGIDRSRPS